MTKWIILSLLLAGGLIGGIIALSSGSGGGGSNHADSTMVTEDSKASQDQAGEETPWTESSYDEDYDNEDWESSTSKGEDHYNDHPKDPPDMVPAPAPLLGGGVVGLTAFLLSVGWIRRRRNNQADIDSRT